MEHEHLTTKEYLNNHGIKTTKQRTLIFNILNQAKKVMTAEAIYFELRKVDDSLSLSTIYRVLNLFVDKGLVLSSNLPATNKCVFELNRLVHQHHLVCLKCQKVVYINDCPLTEFERHVEQQTNFNIIKHKLEMYGYCNNCKETSKENSR